MTDRHDENERIARFTGIEHDPEALARAEAFGLLGQDEGPAEQPAGPPSEEEPTRVSVEDEERAIQQLVARWSGAAPNNPISIEEER